MLVKERERNRGPFCLSWFSQSCLRPPQLFDIHVAVSSPVDGTVQVENRIHPNTQGYLWERTSGVSIALSYFNNTGFIALDIV